MKTKIVELLYQTVNIFNAETRQPRDYGAEQLMYHSEVHLISAIFNHKEANASELAQVLGITNGAVTQVANKLVKKGLIERYKLPGNKKETYFLCTEQGEKVHYGHEDYHKKILVEAMKYIDSLEHDKVEAIDTFLNKVNEGVSRM